MSAQEVLSAGCVVALLGMIPPLLARYQWFSPLSNLYIWTILWLAVSILNTRYFSPTTSMFIASNGWGRNFYTLWDLYGMIGDDRSCGEAITMANMVPAVIVTVLAATASHYITTRSSVSAGPEEELEEEVKMREDGVKV